MSAGLTNVEKALALARLGIKVFPVDKRTRAPKITEREGGKGFYDAVSDDFELIATWFTADYPESTTAVGVWTGGSGLLALDIDKGKKNGKDGFAALADAGLVVTATENYTTASGGQHHIWNTDRLDLAPQQDATVNGKKLEGIDIRAAGSYIVWWGDTVPDSREAFSNDLPAWVVEASTSDVSTFDGVGFSGSVADWLEAIPDEPIPSSGVRHLLGRIPTGEFGHPEMVELAWELVRLGSERETGVEMALGRLRDEWLRGDYNTAANRRDLDTALKGAINKAGRVQTPIPAITPLREAMKLAEEAGVDSAIKRIERKVSETDTEIDFARARRGMFKAAAKGGLTPATALGIVTGSKAFANSKASIDSVWFGDGEPSYHDIALALAEAIEQEEADGQAKVDAEVEAAKLIKTLAEDAAAFTFLSPGEKSRAESYEWFGKEYLDHVKSRLKHFNKPYHVGSMWAALSVIASPWGKVPLSGAKATDCNLYFSILGESTSGKTESWEFGMAMIDAYYGLEESPVIGDISKLSSLALHRQLILRDTKPSLVYGDEIQSFFQGVTHTQWQNGILGDISSHYGGNVSPKLTLNDKEISGKRARTMLTTYLTGIAEQMLDAISLHQWTNGLFYRYIWGFGEPRKPSDFEVKFETASAAYTAQFEAWARELRKLGALQEMKWGAGRIVEWEEDANVRLNAFLKQIDTVVGGSPLYDSVFVGSNLRFATSIMKCATLVALSEASEKVTLDHVLIAINFAGPWHRSMVLAVSETGKEVFEREVEKALVWIRRNAIRQVGKPAIIQRSAVMRAFKPNEVADRLLRQLTEEGWLNRSGDTYELTEGA